VGGSVLHYNKTQAAFNTTQGAYSFDGSFTNHPVADFMLGLARTYSESSQRYVRTYAFDQTEWYLQDDWRVSRKLTLNVGARLFVLPMIHVDGNLMSSFLPSQYNPAKAPGIDSSGTLISTAAYDPLNGIVFPEKNGVPRGFPNTSIGFAPRGWFCFRSQRRRQTRHPRWLRNLLPEHRQQCQRPDHQSTVQLHRCAAERLAR